MERVDRIPLDALRSRAAYVILSTDLALVSEHESSDEARRAFEDLTRRSSRDFVLFKRTAIGWFPY